MAIGSFQRIHTTATTASVAKTVASVVRSERNNYTHHFKTKNMHPIQFKEANRNFVIKDENGRQVPGSDLPAFNNANVTISCWAITAEDKKIINETGCVWLIVHGGISTPPVALTAYIPFEAPKIIEP